MVILLSGGGEAASLLGTFREEYFVDGFAGEPLVALHKLIARAAKARKELVGMGVGDFKLASGHGYAAIAQREERLTVDSEGHRITSFQAWTVGPYFGIILSKDNCREAQLLRMNPDCIRDILLVVEETTSGRQVTMPFTHERLAGYSVDELSYHMGICKQNGYLLNPKLYKFDSWAVSGLTPDGHRLLGEIRDNTIWRKLLKGFAEVGKVALPEAVAALFSSVS